MKVQTDKEGKTGKNYSTTHNVFNDFKSSQ